MQSIRTGSSTLIAMMMVPLLLANASAADRHVVSTAEVHKAAVSATATREANAEKVDKLLSSPQAEAALEASGMDLSQVKNAVSTLDDAELAKLAARADQAQSDFAAGRLSDRDILWVVVGIAALILIIVAVR